MKAIRLLCIFAMAFIMMSCKSNQKKAEELIRQDLFESLYDFESYEPISTTIRPAKKNAENDSLCIALSLMVFKTLTESNEHKEAAIDAKDYMDIWGSPSYYSSSYSDNQYYKYRKKYLEEAESCNALLNNSIDFGIELENRINELDTAQVIGWEVFHKFRCKTYGGMPFFGHYRYIIDQNMKNILFEQDMDDSEMENIKGAIAMAKGNGFSKLKQDK